MEEDDRGEKGRGLQAVQCLVRLQHKYAGASARQLPLLALTLQQLAHIFASPPERIIAMPSNT